MIRTIRSTPRTDIPFNPQTHISIFDDFTWANEQTGVPSGPFGLASSGNAGGGPFTPANVPAGAVAGRWGAMAYGLGTSNNATGQGFYFSDYASYYAGQCGTLIESGAIYTPATLSDGTNTYSIELGFRSSASNANATNSMAILYESSTSLNWQLITSNNGTATKVVSGTPVTGGAWWNWMMVITGTSVTGYVALPGAAWTSIGSSTTNLPDSTHTAYKMGIIYRAATFALQRLMIIDWNRTDITFSSPR